MSPKKPEKAPKVQKLPLGPTPREYPRVIPETPSGGRVLPRVGSDEAGGVARRRREPGFDEFGNPEEINLEG